MMAIGGQASEVPAAPDFPIAAKAGRRRHRWQDARATG
jgi:hypothetical protein